MTRWKILEAVAAEREKQDHAWPDQWAADGTDPMTKLAILGEEFGECCREALEHGETAHLRHELVQCAAVAVAYAESIPPVDQEYAGEEMEI